MYCRPLPDSIGELLEVLEIERLMFMLIILRRCCFTGLAGWVVYATAWNQFASSQSTLLSFGEVPSLRGLASSLGTLKSRRWHGPSIF